MNDIDNTLEQLLRRASPRPVPDAEAAAAAREAVRSEWQAVSGRHRSRRKVLRFAVAASVLVAVFSVFSLFRVAEVGVTQVASIQKSSGSIYVLGEQSELLRAEKLTAIHEGQVIVTGDDAGIALTWSSGGSLRLDKNTEVDFRDHETVFLRSGQIYFDSQASELIANVGAVGPVSFQVETEHGVVSHVGTQFMTEVNAGKLKVSVREGQVDVAGQYYAQSASRGEQLVFSGRQRPLVLSFPEYGAAWDWIAAVSPSVSVNGKSVHEFLNWAGRELGMSIRYIDDDVERVARKTLLVGRIDTEPREALRLRMMTVALDWRSEEGVIYVSNSL